MFLLCLPRQLFVLLRRRRRRRISHQHQKTPPPLRHTCIYFPHHARLPYIPETRGRRATKAAAVDQLQVENRELRGLQERMRRKERRARDLKKKNGELGEQHTALLEDYEACQEKAGLGYWLSDR